MRKYIRSIIRAEAKKKKAKPSKWVKVAFDTHQTMKYGSQERKRNQAKGTHKKRFWAMRTIGIAAE